jgi:tetratricopeptide (TPR) repeat protein
MLGKLRGGAGEVAPGLELLGEARKNLQRARSGNPGDLNLLAHEATVNLYRADVLLAAGRQTEAAEAFGAAVGVLRNAKGVGLNRALYLQLATASSRLAKMMGEKRPLEAKRLYAESLEVYRQLAEAGGSAMIDWNEYANAMNECPYPELRKPAEAVRYAGKAVEATKGRNPSALDTLAWAYHWAGQREEAVATQRKALALLPAGKSPFRELLEKGLAEFEKAK